MKRNKVILIINVIVILVICSIIVIRIRDKKNKIVTYEQIEGTKISRKGNSEGVEWVDSLDGKKVPVPNGFKASTIESEKYVNGKYTGDEKEYGGFVIYEGEEEVNADNIEEEQKTRNQYVWIPIDSTEGWTSEAKILSREGYDGDKMVKKNMNEKVRERLLEELEKCYEEMKKSVEEYGGYYVGRYETGNLSKNIPVVQRYNEDIGSQTWYKMYEKITNLSTENVEAHMIWGKQWDEMLNWIIETKEKTEQEVNVDSTSWGNYRDAGFTFKNAEGSNKNKNKSASTIIPTGGTEYTKANNIYDVAGNVYDWTLEAYISKYRSRMGGYCYNTGSQSPASNRTYGYPTDYGIILGCRVALYIK